MKICVIVDSFKGTMSSIEVSESISEELRKNNHTIDIIPISDGGEGMVDSLSTCIDGELVKIRVGGPLGREVEASYLLSGKDAYIEMASAGGILLLREEERDPLKTSTYGVGELILDAITRGAENIYLGIGGSCTNDGGAGLAQALGASFFSKEGKIAEKMNGDNIGKVVEIDLEPLKGIIKNIKFSIISDVENPLLGDEGCARIFGNQKGADDLTINILETNMKKFSEVVFKTIGVDNSREVGAGASGGLGFGSISFLGGKIRPGLRFIANKLNLEKRISKCDLVIVGEGRIDNQSLFGKAPIEIAKIAKSQNKRVIGVFGLSELDSIIPEIDEIYSVVPTVATLEQSTREPRKYMKELIKTIELTEER